MYVISCIWMRKGDVILTQNIEYKLKLNTIAFKVFIQLMIELLLDIKDFFFLLSIFHRTSSNKLIFIENCIAVFVVLRGTNYHTSHFCFGFIGAPSGQL